jgi:hypothetical protein
MEETKFTHPSFGMVRWNRTQGGKTSDLFGSSIEYQDTITLTIARGEVTRNLNRDWYYARKDLIEIQMTPIQFAEFITSPNQGSGIPCTIRYTAQDGTIPGQEIPMKRKQFEDEFEKECQNINKNFETLKQSINDLKVSNKVKEELQSQLFKVSRIMDDHIPFIQKSFNEQVDKTVLEAKVEVEAFVENKIRQTGLEALKNSNLLLTKSEED